SDHAGTGESLLDVLGDTGLGSVVFSPLAQGMLTSKYLDGVPQDSRRAKGGPLRAEYLSEENLAHIRALNQFAADRGQTLPMMSLAWLLRDPRVTTRLVRSYSVTHLDDPRRALEHLEFSES